MFHIYGGFSNKFAKIGNFIKVSVRKARPSNFFKRGKKSKAFLVRSAFKSMRKDGSYIFSASNSCVLLKRRMTPRGRELKGPIFYGVKRKRFTTSFISVV